jgi:hypothetical protein
MSLERTTIRPTPPPAPHRGQAIESKPIRIQTVSEGTSVSALKEKLGFNSFLIKKLIFLAGIPMSPPGGKRPPIGAVSMYGGSAPTVLRSTISRGVISSPKKSLSPEGNFFSRQF